MVFKPGVSWGSRLFDALNVVLMLVLVIVMIYPFVYVLAASLSHPAMVSSGAVTFWPKGFTWIAYERVASDSYVWLSYWNTIKYTILQTFFGLLATSMLAYPLSKSRIVGRKFFLMMIAFTLIFSGGLIPTFLVVQQTGLLNTTWAMIIPTLITTFYFFIMKTFFEGLPEELEDAAKIDGSNYFGILFRIVLPLSLPVMATIGLFIAVQQWNSFFEALIYLNDRQKFPLQIHLRNIVIANSAASQTEVREGEEMIILETVKYATIMFATLPILCVYPFIQKYFVQGAMIGSLKG